MKYIYIDKHITMGKNVEIGPNCSILSYDMISKSHLNTTIQSGAKIGAGTVIMPGVTISTNAITLPGSVVTRSVPALAIVQGNPAIITGYLSTHNNVNKTITNESHNDKEIEYSTVKEVTLNNLPNISDLRGDLSVGEFEKQIPFFPKRYFIVFNVPTEETRGEHAHKQCKQFLICIKGSCKVIADDGNQREEFILDRPDKGLYLPSMTWGIQYRYSQDAILLVFASDYYDANDYIRDYDEFFSIAKKSRLEQ